MKCPRWFFNWVWGGRPLVVGEDLPSLIEIIEEHTRDLGVMNTSIARIERKQNRWLEILNLKDKGDGDEKALSSEGFPTQGPADASQLAPACGETLDYDTQFF